MYQKNHILKLRTKVLSIRSIWIIPRQPHPTYMMSPLIANVSQRDICVIYAVELAHTYACMWVVCSNSTSARKRYIPTHSRTVLNENARAQSIIYTIRDQSHHSLGKIMPPQSHAYKWTQIQHERMRTKFLSCVCVCVWLGTFTH